MGVNMKDWILLVVGAILGTILSWLFPKLISTIQSKLVNQETRRRNDLLRSGQLWDWLVEYYSNKGKHNELYSCNINGFEAKIPFLSLPEWSFTRLVSRQHDNLLKYARSAIPKFPRDMKRIMRRSFYKQRILPFDEPVLYLDRISQVNNYIHLHVKECNYFQVATRIVNLEDESFRAAYSQKTFKIFNFQTRTPYRNQYLPDIETGLARSGLTPIAVGCAVVVAFKLYDNSYEIILHQRSQETITCGGTITVLPNYGIAPLRGNVKLSSTGILFNNFIREYLEELFNHEELIHCLELRKTNPQWFYDIHEAQKIISSSSFNIEITGIGFNAANGVLNIAMLARIDDCHLCNELRQSISGNWEVQEPTLDKDVIEFVRIDSDKLSTYLKTKRYNPASAFAVARALQRIRSI
jgi:hypothetical protein